MATLIRILNPTVLTGENRKGRKKEGGRIEVLFVTTGFRRFRLNDPSEKTTSSAIFYFRAGNCKRGAKAVLKSNVLP
jgi:hypothetical protein